MTSRSGSSGWAPVAIQGLSRKLMSTVPRNRPKRSASRPSVLTRLRAAEIWTGHVKPSSSERATAMLETSASMATGPRSNSSTPMEM